MKRKHVKSAILGVSAFFFLWGSFGAQADQPEAPVKTVHVYCDKILGPSQVGRALWFGGDMIYWGDTDDESLIKHVLQPWKALQPEGVALDTALREWLHITRNEKGVLEIDFKEYDKKMAKTLRLLSVKPENVLLCFEVPKELSSWQTDNYFDAMPKDMEEWKWFVEQVIRHNLQKNWKVQNYGVAGEPDCCTEAAGSWKMNFPKHVKLYAATCQAAGKADPTVKIWTPGTMNWQGTKYTQGSPTLGEWIRELARYNARVSPQQKVKLTRLGWQDYAWSSDKISDGKEAVKAMLAKNGFQATEFGLAPSGWGSWCSDYLDETLPPHRRASYVVSNVIREFKTPQPDIGLMSYYTFRADPCLGEEGDSDASLFRVAAVTSNCFDPEGQTSLTPIYAGFEAVAKLRDGQIIDTDASATGLETMAVINKDGLPVVILNNHGPEPIKIKLEVHGVPFQSGKVNHVIQRIDERHSRGGKKGLEDGVWLGPLPCAETVEVLETVDPYGTVVETFWPDYSP